MSRHWNKCKVGDWNMNIGSGNDKIVFSLLRDISVQWRAFFFSFCCVNFYWIQNVSLKWGRNWLFSGLFTIHSPARNNNELSQACSFASSPYPGRLLRGEKPFDAEILLKKQEKESLDTDLPCISDPRGSNPPPAPKGEIKSEFRVAFWLYRDRVWLDT